MKQLIISDKTSEKKWALVNDKRLDRLELYPPFSQTKVGNIYSGTIASIKPSLHAAFVMFDNGPKGYLPLKSIPDAGPVHQGMRLLVQVKKDEEASKGPVLTGDIELSGRYMVYFPFTQMVRHSKKISPAKRKTLNKWAEHSLKKNGGLLIRSEAEFADEALLSAELNELQSRFSMLIQTFNSKKGVHLLDKPSKFLDDIKEVVLKSPPDEVITDTAGMSSRLKSFVSESNLKTNIELHAADEDLFQAYLKEDIVQLMTRQIVWLDGGSSIVIDPLEAMTVIDVNSSKQTGSKHHQTAAKEINTKAALESLRQMRIRDMHGIIVIDFINMESASDRAEIDLIIKEEAKKDVKHVFTAGFTELGLYQLTRKKTKASYHAVYTVPCPVCAGKGRVPSPESCLLELEKELLIRRRIIEKAEIKLTKDILSLIKEDPAFLTWIEDELNIPVKLIEIEHTHSYYELR
ncbi:ribonuclease E/G [Jeotgalibacillus salarius]|uniref:S1 motif domain-containing protein n=1 Tax=Jeotgalibacillus salarius TaxID=546023 RepID=A0A4Y8LIX4_9BACL|nr:ribonuclease E/G [Jeotgalibacillus salarius]TFE01032.1 hypothetical protein E2626_10230 [Jeotgalibacillus salarius]